MYYAYNADGIRTAKLSCGIQTSFLLDGGDVVAEAQNDVLYASYLRGVNLICRDSGSAAEYYLFDAHADVIALTDETGAVTKSYEYDAFGCEASPDPLDANPFRYCGEYYDVETGSYYLRARYYAPTIGRFTQQDTHWSTANMIYGDNPQKINEKQDALGLNTYTMIPQITAVMQAGNLYVYCGHSPITYLDPTGDEWYHWVIGGLIVAAAAAAVVITAGGALPAVCAVGAVANGMAAATTASTIAAGAFIGSSCAMGYALVAADYRSINDFRASADWGTVAFAAGGLLVGGIAGYTLYRNNGIKIAGRGSTGRVDARNLNEQLAMKQVMSDPLNGAKQLGLVLNDSRWLATDGWVKMQNIVYLSDGTKINIHFVYNTITKMFDDFKFV